VDLRQQIITAQGDSTVRIRLESSAPADEPGEESLVLDIDAYQNYQENPQANLQRAMEAIKEKHALARSVFEELISDDYRAFLRGGDDA
jgi:uncharacterized protein (TIGR04255 family)